MKPDYSYQPILVEKVLDLLDTKKQAVLGAGRPKKMKTRTHSTPSITPKSNLISIAQATTAMQWLHETAGMNSAGDLQLAAGPDLTPTQRRNRKQGLVVLGLIRGLERCLDEVER
jgi:hypothetical protein